MDSIGVEGGILRRDIAGASKARGLAPTSAAVPVPLLLRLSRFSAVSPVSLVLSSARFPPIEMGQVRRVTQFWVLSSEFSDLSQISALIFQCFRITQNFELKTQNFPVTQHFEGLGIINEKHKNDHNRPTQTGNVHRWNGPALVSDPLSPP